MKVLIIDDDREQAVFLSEVISEVSPGIKCFIAHNYAAARMIIDEEDLFEFIFLDAMIYPAGGKETLMQLSQVARIDASKIVINGDLIGEARVNEFLDLGADRVLQKSSDYYALTAAIKEIICGETRLSGTL